MADGAQDDEWMLDMQYLAHPFNGMFDVIVPPRFSVPMRLFCLTFCNYVALAPFVVWQSP